MLTQAREIQESVRAEGMKQLERDDWNGVKMQLIRIFEQEQLIVRKDTKSASKYCEYCRSCKDLVVATDACPGLKNKSDEHRWVVRTGQMDYDYYDGTKDSNVMVKRVIFKFNSNLLIPDAMNGGTQRLKYKEYLNRDAIAEKAHCLKIVKVNNFYTGFIQLKEYTSLYEVAKLLALLLKAGTRELLSPSIIVIRNVISKYAKSEEIRQR